MCKVFPLTVILFLTAIVVTAQDISLTRHQADSLILTLDKPLAETDRLKTLLLLAAFNNHQRGATDSLLNATRDYIGKAEELNKRLNFPFFREQVQLIQSGLYKAAGNPAAGKALLAQLIEKLQTENNKALLGAAYFEMSEYYDGDYLHETMLERIRYLKLAIAAFEQTNHLVDLARCYRFLADLHQMTNNNADAFAEVRTALKYYEQAGSTENQGALSLLGRLYYEQGDYKQALNYELMGLRAATASSNDNVRLICQINNNIGYTYFKLNENKKALQYFMQALQIAEQDKDNATIYLLAANVVDAYLKMNNPQAAVKFFQHITKTFPLPKEKMYEGGDYGYSQTYLKIYLALKRYDMAQVYCDQLIEQTRDPNINLYPLSLYYQLIARYYIETSNYDKAKYYLTKDKDLVDTLKNLWGIAENYQLRFSLDTASGNFKGAIGNLIDAHHAKDSIFDATKSKQIAQLEVEFETEKKESQINLLNQKAVLENTKLKQAQFVKNVTIAGVVLSLIIAGLLYRQSRFRKKSNVIVTQKNDQLQHLLKEKEWLVKEIHHRVKNNLQTVMSLLNSQSAYIDNEHALMAIHDSQHRVQAMSLIHQKLYNSENVSAVDVSFYIRELVSYLADSFDTGQRIRFEYHIVPLEIEVSQAVPLGLILNEAITNSIKYAFPDGRKGAITISLEKTGPDHYLLSISDNGIGMPANFNGKKRGSLGMSLMEGLSEDLDGNFSIENNNGTTIKISFVHVDGVERPNTPGVSFVSNNQEQKVKKNITAST